jgi:hypothetical protein
MPQMIFMSESYIQVAYFDLLHCYYILIDILIDLGKKTQKLELLGKKFIC